MILKFEENIDCVPDTDPKSIGLASIPTAVQRTPRTAVMYKQVVSFMVSMYIR